MLWDQVVAAPLATFKKAMHGVATDNLNDQYRDLWVSTPFRGLSNDQIKRLSKLTWTTRVPLDKARAWMRQSGRHSIFGRMFAEDRERPPTALLKTTLARKVAWKTCHTQVGEADFLGIQIVGGICAARMSPDVWKQKKADVDPDILKDQHTEWANPIWYKAMGLPVQGAAEGPERVLDGHRFGNVQVVPNGWTDTRGRACMVAARDAITNDKLIIPRPDGLRDIILEPKGKGKGKADGYKGKSASKGKSKSAQITAWSAPSAQPGTSYRDVSMGIGPTKTVASEINGLRTSLLDDQAVRTNKVLDEVNDRVSAGIA